MSTKGLAGQQLGKFFDTMSSGIGRLANYCAGVALKAGTDRFMPNLAQSELPAILRASQRSPLPRAAESAARLGVAGVGLSLADRVFDQQSKYSQPMATNAATRDMQLFLQSQQLQNQKFMHDMALVQARAESRIPGAQYPGSLNPMAADRAFEKSLLDEVGIFGRGIYGTGLRA